MDTIILGEYGRKFKEMGSNRDIYCYANREVVNFDREYRSLPPATKILLMPQLSSCQTKFRGKNEKRSFQAKIDLSLGSSLLKI